jgi:hypothetical protein
MAQAVFGIAGDEAEAGRIISALRAAGFPSAEISVLLPDRSGTHELRHDAATKLPEGASLGAGTGALLGGTVGWLSGVGAVALPGLGALIAAGPILGTLSGVAAGATVGGLSGALLGYAVPEFEARLYESKLRDGNYLISVHTESVVQQAHAREILADNGASHVSQREEAAV